METSILREFGLTKNEIEIFLLLVRKRTLNATKIAKETGLNRPYVYYALERLLEKGYLSQLQVEGKKHFRTLELEQIAVAEEHKLELLKKMLLELKRIPPETTEETIVEVLKGKFVVKSIFKKILAEIRRKEEILYLGLEEEQMEMLEPVYLEKLLDYLTKNKIKERAIIKSGGKKLTYTKTTFYRHLPRKILGNAAKIIYQDIVIELIYGTPIYAVILKNNRLAETARIQFEFFWKRAKY